MTLKQGNTYQLKATIDTDLSRIDKILFQFDSVKKEYLSDGTGEVQLESGIFTVPLTQEDTLLLDELVNCEVAVKFQDGSVKRSRIIEKMVLDTIIEEII